MQVNVVHNRSSENMAEVDDGSIALVVTSPPYHVGKPYDTDGTWEEYLAGFERVARECYRALEWGGRMVVNVANLWRSPYIPLADNITAIMGTIGFLNRGQVIWVKGEGASGSCAWGSWCSASNPQLRDLHEYCLCFSKGDFKRQRIGESTIAPADFVAWTLSIWHILPESATRVGHPAPFPVELPRRFIELYTYRDEIVLDPYLGSGSTAIAALQTHRRYIGYELDVDYARLARQRIEAVRMQTSLLDGLDD